MFDKLFCIHVFVYAVVSLFMQMNAWRGFPRVCFTRPWGNREGNSLPYLERIDDHGTSVLCVCVFLS